MSHCEGENGEQDERAQGEMLGTIQGGGSMPPLREVLNDTPTPEETKETDNFCPTVSKCENDVPMALQSTENTRTCQHELPRVEQGDLSGGNSEPPLRGVPNHPIDCNVTIEADMPHPVAPATKAPEASSE